MRLVPTARACLPFLAGLVAALAPVAAAAARAPDASVLHAAAPAAVAAAPEARGLAHAWRPTGDVVDRSRKLRPAHTKRPGTPRRR